MGRALVVNVSPTFVPFERNGIRRDASDCCGLRCMVTMAGQNNQEVCHKDR